MKYIQYLLLLMISVFSMQCMDHSVDLNSQQAQYRTSRKVCGNLKQLIAASYNSFRRLAELFYRDQSQENFSIIESEPAHNLTDLQNVMVLNLLDLKTLCRIKMAEKLKDTSYMRAIKTLIAQKKFQAADILKIFTISPKACGLTDHRIDNIISSHDLQYIMTVSSPIRQENCSLVVLWDLATCEPIRHFSVEYKINGVAISEDNSFVLAYNEHGVQLWDIESGNDIAFYQSQEPLIRARFFGESNIMLASDKKVMSIDRETGKAFNEMNLDQFIFAESQSKDLTLRCSGTEAQLIDTKSDDQQCLQVYDNEKEITASLVTDSFFVLALSDGKILIYDFFDTERLI